MVSPMVVRLYYILQIRNKLLTKVALQPRFWLKNVKSFTTNVKINKLPRCHLSVTSCREFGAVFSNSKTCLSRDEETSNA